MNALEMLRSDHEKMSSLFEQLQEADDLAQRNELVELIRDELLVHSRVEEAAFYPAFRNRPGFEEMIEDSSQEHQEFKDLLAEIAACDEEDEDERDPLLDELQECFDRHVDFEEGELFPKIEEILDDQELVKLGEKLIDARQAPSLAA